MGKIHKALEKSNRERKEKPKSKSDSLKTIDTGLSPRDITGQSVGERSVGPPASVPVSQGLDLGTIHEILHESVEAGAPKLNDKNKTPFKDIHTASVPQKAPSVSSQTLETPPLSVKYEEAITSDLETDPKDSLQKTSDENIAPDTHDFIQANAPFPKTDLPASRAKSSATKKPITGQKYESANNEKVLAFSPNEVNEKKIFALKEKTLNKSDREEVAEETVPNYVHKSDSALVDSGFTSHSAVDSSLVTLLKPRSYEAEQFKILRTNLLFPESGHPAKSVLITSAAPGDGKSFVSANLAVSLALNYNRKVLLIDADVRRSATHKIFGLKHVEKGICDFLSGRLPLTSLLVKTSLSNLIILPAGKLMRGQAELRSLENLPKLFEELEAHFNEYFIVVDSPPPKLASETGVLARLVDSIVIVIKSGVTKRKLVEDTMDLIGKGKIAGIVFNWHEDRMSSYKKYAKKRGYYS